MFGKTIRLFEVLGFTVRIDVSWFVIFALVLWSLSADVFPRQHPHQAWWVYGAMGAAGAAGMFISIVVHELCHSLVARRFGVPMRGITLFLLGGVAEMEDEPSSPRAEFLMAVAGPAASLVMGAALIGLSAAGKARGWPTEAMLVCRWVGIINLILAAFNMVPGFPLDGGRVLRSLLWALGRNLRRATDAASQVGAGFGLAATLFGFVLLLAGDPLGGMWMILIGMFLRGAARQAFRQVLIRQALRGEPIRRFMNPGPISVPPTISLQDLVDDYIYRYHFKMFPVVEGDSLLGCITTRRVREVPQAEWASRTVGETALACSKANTLPPDLDAMEALSLMGRTGASRVMVVEEGRLVGMLSLKDLLGFLSRKLELETGRAGDSFD